MKHSTRIVLLALVVAFSVMLLAIGSSSGQVKKGKTRPLQTKNLMKGVVAANCGALKEALEAGPADDDAWAAIVMHAELINEAGHILMADGRCPDSDWADAATALREGSETVLVQAEAQNADGAQEAFGEMTKACGACHKAHKN